ncbi:tetratricopeptide repeat protein [Parabacteroides sp. PF5-9]|uniref:tetratricopeptide repeat protein n=1 Tax=Parabacteroides sp. PF5-9 TaxID=1742404 RepID=UPI002475F7F4|nr:tetratricopeptide repeat protein [Parabacteroides sp. PF5-9]MDH6359209.1 TolA-binding protein [Parabacteroides sp. PF5-9]
MRRILIPLCLVLCIHWANGQRSYQFESPNRLFVEGKELFELKNYAGCIDKLEAYKLRATDVDLIQEADYMLAYIAFEQGKEDADLLLKDYLDRYPSSRHKDVVAYQIGSAHFGKGAYERAIFWFNQSNLDVLNPEQQEAYSFRLAYSLLQTGEINAARNYFARIQQIGLTYRDASSYYVAYIDYADAKYNEALIEFARLQYIPEYHEQSSYYIAQIYFIQNKYEQVIREGESLLATYPDSENNTELYRIVGNSYYHLDNQRKALTYLQRYAEQTDDPLRGDLYILGVCYYNQADFRGAVGSFGRVVNQNDALTQNAYLYLGQAYLKLNDKNNARMAFEAAATASYDRDVKEAAMYNYALLIHETGFTGFGESVTIFEDFLNDFPNSRYADKVNDYLVEVYLTTKNYEAALNSINKINRPSTKILEAKQDILFQLGTQSFTNVRMEEAISLFNQAISLGTYNQEARNDAYFWRGESYYRMGNYNEAISDYRSYVNNTRQRGTDMYALAHYNLGYSYFKQQNYNQALTYFRQYTGLERDQRAASLADTYNRIGDCLFNNRQFTQAEENYARAAQIAPSAGDYALYQRGYVLGLQKNYRGKIQAMDRLVRDYPESQYADDALFEKGRAYVLMENNREAAQTFEALINRYPQSSLARKGGVQLGLIYFNDNQLQKSADAYKKVISNYPGSEEARVSLQDLRSVYIELNDINAYAKYVNSLGGNIRFEASEQDSLTYLAAEMLFMRGDNTGAQRSLVNYLQTYPMGAFSSNANYYLGSIAFTQKNYTDAKRYFTSVVDAGDTKFQEEAVARKAEIEYLEKDYTAAFESFKRLNLIAEGPENKQAARLGMMRCAQFTNRTQEALLAANDLLKDQKLSPELIAEARYVRAKAYIAQNQQQQAREDLLEVSRDTRTAHGAEAKYLLAQLYFDHKEDANAEKVLEDFAKNGTPHQYWLARGFILWADIYIRKGDDVQARVYLNSLQSNYKGKDDITSMIESRLSQLKN